MTTWKGVKGINSRPFNWLIFLVDKHLHLGRASRWINEPATPDEKTHNLWIQHPSSSHPICYSTRYRVHGTHGFSRGPQHIQITKKLLPPSSSVSNIKCVSLNAERILTLFLWCAWQPLIKVFMFLMRQKPNIRFKGRLWQWEVMLCINASSHSGFHSCSISLLKPTPALY